MVIGIEFNKMKTTSGKTFFRVAPYLENVDKMKVGVISFIIFSAIFLMSWSSYSDKAMGQETTPYYPYGTINH